MEKELCFRWMALFVLLIFYAVYFIKMWTQKKETHTRQNRPAEGENAESCGNVDVCGDAGRCGRACHLPWVEPHAENSMI